MLEDPDVQLYAERLGALKVNLLSLEFALRMFLYNDEVVNAMRGTAPPVFAPFANPERLRIGDCVPLNAFTNYDTLGQLIAKYNQRVAQSASELSVDPALVELRDALAHGRASAPVADGPIHLLKFSRPQPARSCVEVTCSMSLDSAWLDAQPKRVLGAVKKAVEANERLLGEGGQQFRARPGYTPTGQ
jgi:hypothetical protein